MTDSELFLAKLSNNRIDTLTALSIRHGGVEIAVCIDLVSEQTASDYRTREMYPYQVNDEGNYVALSCKQHPLSWKYQRRIDRSENPMFLLMTDKNNPSCYSIIVSGDRNFSHTDSKMLTSDNLYEGQLTYKIALHKFPELFLKNGSKQLSILLTEKEKSMVETSIDYNLCETVKIIGNECTDHQLILNVLQNVPKLKLEKTFQIT